MGSTFPGARPAWPRGSRQSRWLGAGRGGWTSTLAATERIGTWGVGLWPQGPGTWPSRVRADYIQCASSIGTGACLPTRRAGGGGGGLTHPPLLLSASRQPKRDTGRRTGPGSCRPARTHDLEFSIRLPDRGPGRGAPSWGRLPGPGSDQSGPDLETQPGTRSRGDGGLAVSQSTHSAGPAVSLFEWDSQPG